jgi:FkbM family methyltransferase
MGLSDKFYRLLWHSGIVPPRWNHLAYRRLRRLGETPSLAFEVDFFGQRYPGDLANDIDSFVYYYGAYEKPNLFFLRDLLRGLRRGQATLLDVGANVGQHTLFAAAHAKRVHAFEPFPDLRRRIDEKVRVNGLKNVTVHPVGLGARDEDLVFYRSGANSVMMGSFLGDFLPANKAGDKLPVRRGDSYLRAQGVGRVDAMKIDVEGFEGPVLQGLRGTLDEHRPVLAVEVTWRAGSPYVADKAALLKLLPEDYRLFVLRGPAMSGTPLQRRRARRSGDYELLPLSAELDRRNDVVACPVEKLAMLPRAHRSSTTVWPLGGGSSITEIGWQERKAA